MRAADYSKLPDLISERFKRGTGAGRRPAKYLLSEGHPLGPQHDARATAALSAGSTPRHRHHPRVVATVPRGGAAWDAASGGGARQGAVAHPLLLAPAP